MQKQKIYKTPEGHKVIATFYQAHVAWYIVEKPMSKGVDEKGVFIKKAAIKDWREVEPIKAK